MTERVFFLYFKGVCGGEEVVGDKMPGRKEEPQRGQGLGML